MAIGTPVVEHWPEREIAQWVHHEGSIRRPTAPRGNALTTELHLATDRVRGRVWFLERVNSLSQTARSNCRGCTIAISIVLKCLCARRRSAYQAANTCVYTPVCVRASLLPRLFTAAVMRITDASPNSYSAKPMLLSRH